MNEFQIRNSHLYILHILDLEQNNLASKVTRVIDHHIDSGAYADQLVEKTCHLVGSACTLLVLMVK